MKPKTPTTLDKDELDEILQHFGNYAYEMGKRIATGYHHSLLPDETHIEQTTAKQAINRLIAKERMEELRELPLRHFSYKVTDGADGVFEEDSRIFISKYEVQERIATLEQSLKEQRNTSGRKE